MKKLFALALLAIASAASADTMDAFIDSLMARMTLTEKLGQMTQLPAGTIQTGFASAIAYALFLIILSASLIQLKIFNRKE